MGRVRVFGTVSNDTRTMTIGGRGRNNTVECRINTDIGLKKQYKDRAIITKVYYEEQDGSLFVTIDFEDFLDVDPELVNVYINGKRFETSDEQVRKRYIEDIITETR